MPRQAAADDDAAGLGRVGIPNGDQIIGKGLKRITVAQEPVEAVFKDLQAQLEKEGKNIAGFEPAVLQALEQHPWPGNVRELRNVINRAYILAWSDTSTLSCLPDELKPKAPFLSWKKLCTTRAGSFKWRRPEHCGRSTNIRRPFQL